MALLRTKESKAPLVVAGQADDMALDQIVKLAKAFEHQPLVIGLTSAMDKRQLSALLDTGIDGLLLRTVGAEEFCDSLDALIKGERVVAPALTITAAGYSRSIPAEPDVDANPLTTKEREVLVSLAEGRTNREIADTLFITPATVKTHLAHIYSKLAATDRHEALARAVALGLLG